MKHEEIVDFLNKNGFDSGWTVRDAKIVVWENKEKIPSELKDYVELDEV